MNRRYFLVVLAVVLASPWVHAAEPAPGQWLVVVAPAFRSAVEPLCEQRKAQGFKVAVVETTNVLTPREIVGGDARRLQERVSKLCRDVKGPRYVLLVGAVEAGILEDADKKVVPPALGTFGRMKGQPSDNGYGLPDANLMPAVAVGRFPARTREEAEAMVQKTLAYEQDHRPGEWRHRLTVLAGIPAFNPFVDKMVENLAMARLAQLNPYWSGRAIYHNQQSRFCVPDDLLHARALEYVQDGQAITLYLGHSGPGGFYAGNARYLDREDWGRLQIRRGPGIFATFGCNGCQLKGGGGEGYGVAAVRNPHGPVAVLGSHGICFAAMVQLAVNGLVDGALTGLPPQRLGEAWLALKAGLAQGKIDDVSFLLLDAVDGDSRIPQADQRLEHTEMFVLLGDPALRLPRTPVDVKLSAAGALTPGQPLPIKVQLPARLAGARVRLTLERPVDSQPVDLEALPPRPGEEQARVMLANHERANHFAVVTKEATAREGDSEATLDVPAKLPWPRLILRAYAATKDHDGLGVLPLPIKPSR